MKFVSSNGPKKIGRILCFICKLLLNFIINKTKNKDKKIIPIIPILRSLDYLICIKTLKAKGLRWKKTASYNPLLTHFNTHAKSWSTTLEAKITKAAIANNHLIKEDQSPYQRHHISVTHQLLSQEKSSKP